jgi:FAD/FMN-containing dehydrogenase
LEKPDTFEVYDDNTLRLALRFFYEFAKNLGTRNVISVAFSFLPEFLLILRGGLPKLVLQIDFQSDDQNELAEKVARLKQALLPFHPDIRIAKNKAEEQKYWLIRRESFNLLRKKIKNLHTAPFIDDFIVPQDAFPQFLAELNKILSDYKNLVYTIAGHIGDGNLHIIPLMDLSSPNFAEIIKEISDRVYDLVIKYGGSITAEHNDGLIRTPYLEKMYGRQVTALFEETKKIFDPQNIFNPRKKVNGTLPFAFSHIRKNW